MNLNLAWIELTMLCIKELLPDILSELKFYWSHTASTCITNKCEGYVVVNDGKLISKPFNLQQS